MQRHLTRMILCSLLACFPLWAQTSHRQANPTPPRQPDLFEQLEKQGEPAKEKPVSPAARKQQRSAQLAELQRELPQVVERAQRLQKQLEAVDLDTALPAGLERQAKELEDLARRIHKRVRNL